ncbi:hypothetical protein L9F63_007112, partial [Diploptera punctata]
VTHSECLLVIMTLWHRPRILKMKKPLCYMLILVIAGYSPFLMYNLYVRAVELQFYSIHMEDMGDNFTNLQCIIPNYDPYDPQIKKFLKTSSIIDCGKHQEYLTYLDSEGYIHFNKTTIETSGHQESDYECIYSEIFRPNGTDEEITLGVPQVFRETEKIRTSHFVLVKCFLRFTQQLVYETVHFYVPPPTENLFKSTRRPVDRDIDHPSVLIFGLDSMSRLNFIRQLPRTYNFLTEVLDSVVFTGMTKCGDNTFPNMIAFLSGKNVHERNQENKLSVKKPTYFDSTYLVWENFSANGYITMYDEDWPSITLFNFGASGFKYVPTDYYIRPFWLALDKIEHFNSDDWRCFANVPKHMYLLDYVQLFTQKMKDHRYFAYSFLTLLSHDDLNMIQVADTDFEAMFMKMWRKGHLNNTVLIVLGDHGNRFSDLRQTDIGRVEERMPFLSVWLPSALKEKYPHLQKGLQSNRNILLSWYDFYEMLMDIASNNLDEESLVTRYGTIGSSPFRKISDKRNCDDVGIPEEYCICARETQLSTNNTRVRTIAEDLVNHMNVLLQSNIEQEMCSYLELTNIISAQLLSLGPGVAKPQGFRVLYRITIQVYPSDAVFEGTLELDAWSEKGHVLGDVNRLNRYGNQSHCISDRILKLYCFCIDLLKS